MRSSGVPRTKSLGRAVDVLNALAMHPGASASKLARVISLPRSTVSRTLRTLADGGLVEEESADSGWILGYELVRLARAADPHRRLIQQAEAPLHQLRDATAEAVSLSVQTSGPGIETILQVNANHFIGLTNWVGLDVPVHASSAGKLALAAMDEPEFEQWLRAARLRAYGAKTITNKDLLHTEIARVRRQHWAETVDELEAGLAGISAGVYLHDRTLVGIVGICAPITRLGRHRRRELLPLVQEAARTIEVALTRLGHDEARPGSSARRREAKTGSLRRE
jgi:DNA-binding IclR family transcriptional regulator